MEAARAVENLGRLTGLKLETFSYRWDASAARFYQDTVGAGSPTNEQGVLPSFVSVMAFGALSRLLEAAGIDISRVLHLRQALDLKRPVAPSGSVSVSARVTEICDDGKNAVIGLAATVDYDGAGPLAQASARVYVKDGGGFGGTKRTIDLKRPAGERLVAVEYEVPMDITHRYAGSSGDWNPLHQDHDYAVARGFATTPVQLLAIYGVLAGIAAERVCDGQYHLIESLSVDCWRPIYPGEKLAVSFASGAGRLRHLCVRAERGQHRRVAQLVYTGQLLCRE